MKLALRKVLSNKIVLYMTSRYVTYAVSFFVNIYIAACLGPSSYGVWAFLLLTFHYFNVIELGIPHAVQVLLVQHKDDKVYSANVEKTGTVLIALLSLVTVVVAVIYSLGGIPKAHELQVGYLFYAICFCGLLNYFTNLYDRIYRCRNRLFELGFKQTSVVFFMAIAMLLFKGKDLLYGLVFSYVLWCIASFTVFTTRGGLDTSGKYQKTVSKEILRKGFFLFLFYSGFSLIIITTRTFISTNYTVEDFGLFSFAYLLGNAVYQCVQAFSVVTITKLISRYHSPDRSVVLSTIKIVRENYVSMFHLIIYLAMIVFPIILHFMPKYSSALVSMNLCALMMVLYTNAYGYSTYLVAVNREKKLAFVAVSSFILNFVFCFILIRVFHVHYEFVVFSTMIAYLFYAYMCAYMGREELGMSKKFFTVLLDCFPIRLLIPFAAAIAVALLNIRNLCFVPIVVFAALNVKTIASMYGMIRKMIANPKIVDI